MMMHNFRTDIELALESLGLPDNIDPTQISLVILKVFHEYLTKMLVIAEALEEIKSLAAEGMQGEYSQGQQSGFLEAIIHAANVAQGYVMEDGESEYVPEDISDIESLNIYEAVGAMKQTMERLKGDLPNAPTISMASMLDLIGVVDGAVFVIGQVDGKVRQLSAKINADGN